MPSAHHHLLQYDAITLLSIGYWRMCRWADESLSVIRNHPFDDCESFNRSLVDPQLRVTACFALSQRATDVLSNELDSEIAAPTRNRRPSMRRTAHIGSGKSADRSTTGLGEQTERPGGKATAET